VNCGPRSYFLYIAITYLLYSHCLLYSHTITIFHSIRLFHCLQQTSEIDNLIVSWEQSIWLCCVQVPCCRSQSKARTRHPINCSELSQASGHHLQSYWLLPPLIDIPWFLNWGKTLLLYSSYLPLGVPNWTVKSYQHLTASVDYSHITPEAGMVMKKASGGDSPLRQGAEKSFWTLPISRRWQRRLAVCFVENWSGGLGFSRRGEYIGRRATSGGGPGAHTMPWRGLGVARAMGLRDLPLAPLRLSFGLRHASGKIGTSTFVSSNSENISCVAFLKHKNNRKRGTGTVASR
jgi:hypothetical protein